MKKREKQTSQLRKKLLIILSPLFACVVLLAGIGIWYQSRVIPNPGDDMVVTSLPLDVAHVLGAKVGPSTVPQISIRVPIFLYHYVTATPSNAGVQNLNIPPTVLTAQIETLKQAGYSFITPNDLTQALSGTTKLPEKSIILSFDDGYIDFYTNVLPILQKEQVKAIFYIVVNFLDRPNYLFTSQLKEIAKSPLVEIGAHTMDHTALAGMNTKNATYQIAQSRKSLQDLLHVPVNSFAYPYGSFNLPTIKIVKDAGFTNAVSTIPGITQSVDNIYFLNRLRPGYRTGKTLLTYLQQNAFQPW